MKSFITAMMLVFTMNSSAEVVPAKNPEPIIKTSFTRQEVAWMYTMKTRFWEDGTKITVFYLNTDSKVHKEFCRDVLGINPDKFDVLVASSLNSGNASYFRLAKDQTDVYDKVSLLPGAIGYLDKETIVINGAGYVKTIKISN